MGHIHSPASSPYVTPLPATRLGWKAKSFLAQVAQIKEHEHTTLLWLYIALFYTQLNWLSTLSRPSYVSVTGSTVFSLSYTSFNTIYIDTSQLMCPSTQCCLLSRSLLVLCTVQTSWVHRLSIIFQVSCCWWGISSIIRLQRLPRLAFWHCVVLVVTALWLSSNRAGGKWCCMHVYRSIALSAFPLDPVDRLWADTRMLLRALCICLGTPGRKWESELEHWTWQIQPSGPGPAISKFTLHWRAACSTTGMAVGTTRIK